MIRNVLLATAFGEAVEAEELNMSDPSYCAAGLLARREMLFASTALQALGGDSEEQQRLLEEFIHFLVLHEMGHTLGLNHNFRASHLHSLEAIFDRDQTYSVGLHGSVMDYPAVPFAMPGNTHGQFYTTRPGPYDHWAITFGYSAALVDPADETARLETILARSTEPALAFGNDADDMRSPGKAIDPRAMVNDMTSDPIGFAEQQINVVNAAVENFGSRLVRDGESYQELLLGFSLAASQYQGAARAASRFIGGVYVDRAMVNQPGAQDPLTPVSLEDQLRAMQLLRDTVFSPDAFEQLHLAAIGCLPNDAASIMGIRPRIRSCTSWRSGFSGDILSHLLHPRVLTRLTDTRAYGNEYPVSEMLVDLTDAVFAADLGGEVDTFRQNLQLEYVDRLLTIVGSDSESGYDHVSRSMALNRLRWIESELSRSPSAGLETTAHREHVLYRITRGLDESGA